MRTGAIVARFQVASLHEGHLHLIDRVKEQCDQLVILLGEPERPNKRNPLSFEIRKAMIMETYPDVIFHQIRDHHEDAIWNENLDNILSKYENVSLFGSRDSFFSFYTGRFPRIEISELVGFSGTTEREKIANSYKELMKEQKNFRLGFSYGILEPNEREILDLSDPKINDRYFRMGAIFGFNLKND